MKGLRPGRRDETDRVSRLQAVGPGVLFGQQDRVGIGEETERIGQFRCGAAVFADAPVAQDVHAQDEEHLARSPGDRRHGLDDRHGVGRRRASRRSWERAFRQIRTRPP